YPKSASSYALHLYNRHKSSPTSNGIYLLCSCGIEVCYWKANPNHSKECDGSQFTLHKLDEKIHSVPQCVLCEVGISLVRSIIFHFIYRHIPQLYANGIYLLCSCGMEFRSMRIDPNNIKKCDGHKFTLHKLDYKFYSTPQCVVCKVYPTTAYGYASHLYNRYKSILRLNGIYLLCSCGMEIRSKHFASNHSEKCDSHKFTLHKLDDKIYSTPQCVLCKQHKSTLNAVCFYFKNIALINNFENGIFLLCSCGNEARSEKSSRKHNGECDGRQFTVHK
ncbi:hypothetical protein PENTCL1PPCAC_13208, partial [Pristionchus entomophagus]